MYASIDTEADWLMRITIFLPKLSQNAANIASATVA